MDLVDWKEDVYDGIHKDFEKFAAKLDVKDVSFIPISALKGDNVVNRSENMHWYEGATLLYYLENVHIASDHNFIDTRFPVQHVIRPYNDEYHDYRGYAGRVSGGILKKGDKVTLLPSGFTSTISKIDTFDGEVEEAFPPMSITILLNDDLDLSRGDMIARENNQPDVSQDIDVMVCWFNERPLQQQGKYTILHTTNEVRCIVKKIHYKLNINTLHRNLEDKSIKMNDIARVVIRTTKPLAKDSYRKNRITGSLIFVDEGTNETVGAGMII
jgi:sulfate adenylyltransferase subunit 1